MWTDPIVEEVRRVREAHAWGIPRKESEGDQFRRREHHRYPGAETRGWRPRDRRHRTGRPAPLARRVTTARRPRRTARRYSWPGRRLSWR